MRKPFDTTCDVFKGPGASSPGSFVGTFACRYVREDAIFTVGNGAVKIPAYMTIEDYEPIGFWEPLFLKVNPYLSDLIAIPSGTLPRYWIVYTDIIVWHAQMPYYRGYLAYLPYGPLFQGGGILLNGSAVIATIPPFTGSGGLVLNGSAVIATIPPFTGSGGLVLNGDTSTSITRKRFVDAGPGGSMLNGSAPWTFTPGVTVYWQDSFTDTDGTLITAHAPTIGSGGYTWDGQSIGTAEIHSNKCVIKTNYPGFYFNPGHISIKATVKVKFAPASQEPGYRQAIVYFRWGSPSNCILFLVDISSGDSITHFSLQKVVAGTPTVIATGIGTLATNTEYVMSVQDDGLNILVDIGGISISASDGSLSGNTNMVLQLYTASFTSSIPYFDDLLVTS